METDEEIEFYIGMVEERYFVVRKTEKEIKGIEIKTNPNGIELIPEKKAIETVKKIKMELLYGIPSLDERMIFKGKKDVKGMEKIWLDYMKIIEV
jgi:hypothetical protein